MLEIKIRLESWDSVMGHILSIARSQFNKSLESHVADFHFIEILAHWKGHVLKALNVVLVGFRRLCDDLDTLDRIAKIASAIFMNVQFHYRGKPIKFYGEIQCLLKEICGVISARSFVCQLKEFAENKHASSLKIYSKVCLLISNVCVTAQWMRDYGLVNINHLLMRLGRVASSYGFIKTYSSIARLSLPFFQTSFLFASLVLSLLDIKDEMSRDNNFWEVKHWLNLMNDTTKIGLLVCAMYPSSSCYIALGLIASLVSLTTYIYEECID